MITGNLILSTFLIVSIIGTSIIAYLSYSRHKKNLYVSDELDILIHRTLERFAGRCRNYLKRSR